MPTIADVFASALQHLQAGNLRQAEQLYRQILQENPGSAQAHHMLGVISHRVGRFDLAAASFRQAANLDSTSPAHYSNLGIALEALGQVEEAIGCYQKALAIRPDFPVTHEILGNALRRQGKLDDAVSQYREAIRLLPNYAEAHCNLAVALVAQGKIEEAIAHHRQALTINPSYAEAHYNLGSLLLAHGKLEEAAKHTEQALRFKPDLVEAHNNLGTARLKQGRPEEAMRHWKEALRFRPNFAEAHSNLASALLQLGRMDEALAHTNTAINLRPELAEAHSNFADIMAAQGRLDQAVERFRQALKINPQYFQAYNNLGNVLIGQDSLDEANECFQHALRIQPDFAGSHNNLGNLHFVQGEYSLAQTAYDETLRLDLANPEAQFNRSILWLLQGKWQEGWTAYESRWQTKGFVLQDFIQPRWDGRQAPAGRGTILLIAEQGLGDTIQFIRYVALVKERGWKVVLQCQPSLQKLLARAPEIDQIVPQNSAAPKFDTYLPLLSLPGIFGTLPDSVPHTIPYLQPDPTLVEQWRRELQSVTGFKVGISWHGSPIYLSNRHRSIPLSYFSDLAGTAGTQLVSLQKGSGSEQLPQPESDKTVLDFGARIDEAAGAFMDTAAIMKNLDLVISSDTAVAHLAGALGVPVWVALPFVPDWRWLLNREDCPWYPSMRLFRQTRRGQWDDVFARIDGELKRAVREKQSISG